MTARLGLYPTHNHLLDAEREPPSTPPERSSWGYSSEVVLTSGGSEVKAFCLQCRRPGFDPWVGKIPWRRKWQPTPVFLPGKSHGRKSLVAYSPRTRKEWDTTKRFHFSLESPHPPKSSGEGLGGPPSAKRFSTCHLLSRRTAPHPGLPPLPPAPPLSHKDTPHLASI